MFVKNNSNSAWRDDRTSTKKKSVNLIFPPFPLTLFTSVLLLGFQDHGSKISVCSVTTAVLLLVLAVLFGTLGNPLFVFVFFNLSPIDKNDRYLGHSPIPKHLLLQNVEVIPDLIPEPLALDLLNLVKKMGYFPTNTADLNFYKTKVGVSLYYFKNDFIIFSFSMNILGRLNQLDQTELVLTHF